MTKNFGIYIKFVNTINKMGQIIKQPNGKYCIFSAVVDSVTDYDMTPQDIIDDWVKIAQREITEKVTAIVSNLENNGKPYFQFTQSYEEMMETIKNIHGEKETSKLRKLMGTTNLAVKIPVIESESGWGRKIDDWMVCLSIDDANLFKEEFNSKNTSTSTPSWYMQVEGEIEPIQISDAQFEKLKSEKRIWLSTLNKI